MSLYDSLYPSFFTECLAYSHDSKAPKYKTFYSRNPISYCCCCSVAKSCPTLWDPMNCSTPGFPVLHYLLQFAQNHVCWIGDAIQPSHPFFAPFSSCTQSFPPSESFPVSRLFVPGGHFIISPSHEYSGLISLRIDWFDLLAIQVTCKNLF